MAFVNYIPRIMHIFICFILLIHKAFLQVKYINPFLSYLLQNFSQFDHACKHAQNFIV